MWDRLAACGSFDDLPRFENEGVPDEALIRYVEEVPAPGVYSERLATLVRERVILGDTASLQLPLVAFGKQNGGKNVAFLLDLLRTEDRSDVRWAIGEQLMRQADPAVAAVGLEECRRHLAERMEKWRTNGAPIRGSPLRWGSPCEGDYLFRRPASPLLRSSQSPPNPMPREFGTHGGWLDEHATILRNLTLLVRPDLDEAVFVEGVPALDAIPTGIDDRPTQVFVNGDVIVLPLPPNAQEEDPAYVEWVRGQIEETLAGKGVLEGFKQARAIDAYVADRRFRLHVPQETEAELIDFANRLLQAVASTYRIGLDPNGQPAAIPAP